jgi:malate dehydrogenase (oxaloacetate-decarboxylating)
LCRDRFSHWHNAFGIRDAFADEIITFNDNIQGTGAVALAAILSAMRAKNESLATQKFLICGADCGGVGICEQLAIALIEEGLSEQEARDAIFLADQDGIITSARAGEYFLKKYAKDPRRFKWLKEGPLSVAATVARSGATVYVSTSGADGCIKQELVSAMQENTERPVIIPLSSPVEISEQYVRNIYEWTEGRALVASGSPLNSFEFHGNRCRVSQGNNILIFPGVGLGVLASGAREVLPHFFTSAARAVSGCVSKDDLEKGQLLPAIADLEKVSNKVALAVAMCAVRNGLSKPCVFSSFQHQGEESRMRELIQRMRWEPNYLPIIPM